VTDARRILADYVDATGRPTRSSPEAFRGVLEALADEPPSPADAVTVAWDGVIAGQDDRLPFGYHPVIRKGEQVGTIISAPRYAPATAAGRWGVFLPLYALRTGRTAGMATYSELDELFDWLRAHGGDLLLTLPLLPVYLDPPADWSPYSPVSRRMWNEIYVDYDEVDAPRLADEPEPVDGLLDHPGIGAIRTARLDAVSERLLDDPGFVAWLAANPLVETYARFRGAQATHGRQFRRWTVGRDEALAAADPVVVRRHLVGQWLADRQLSEVASRAREHRQVLALDVALGTHADGFDVWHEGDLFVDGVTVGAPPDQLFLGGQNWGFPPVHPDRSRRTGHRYFRDTIRHHLRHAGLLRIDHVMGLARQWWIPAGNPATEGCYVRYPLDELLAVACLEAHLAGAVLVGENLGTVPPDVISHMRAHRVLGIDVAEHSMTSWGTDDIRVASPGTMAAVSTHDMVPLAGWWRGTDIDIARDLQLIDDETSAADHRGRIEVRERVIAHLVWTGRLASHDADYADIVSAVMDEVASQPAEIDVFNLEDFWAEDRPHNVPGTFQEQPNWRRVAARTIDEFAVDPMVTAMADRVAQRRREAAARHASGLPFTT